MKVYADTIIYIITPGNIRSGGAELLHQLASQLLCMNYNAFIHYVPTSTAFNPQDPVDNAYKKYHIPYTQHIEYNHKNIVIVPETSSLSLYMSPKMRRIMWWMSVDNYVNNLCNILKKFKSNPMQSTVPKFFYFAKEDNDIEHWVQSEYAETFIKNNGILNKRIFKVRDYLNETFLMQASKIDMLKKENIVVYNPLKGFDFTQKLIKMAPDINWQPIRNMTPEQVQQLLARAKIYIDFGHHPGRDRIPREATISGCCILTSRRGSAANSNDIAIDDSFKFEDTNNNLLPIIEKIQDIFKNFLEYHAMLQLYREQIINEKADFERDVKAAFDYKEIKNQPIKVALAPTLTQETYRLAEQLISNKSEMIPYCVMDEQFTFQKGGAQNNNLIKTIRNINYLNVNETYIPIMSVSDVKFLYRSKRIEKFVTYKSNDELSIKIKNYITSLGVRPQDLLII